MFRRSLSTSRALLSHENPIGLPRAKTAPQLPRRQQRGLPEKRSIRDVGKVVAVSSAKGGVGKSTIAANLAISLGRRGHRVGILDTDIFGPSIPKLFDLNDEPRLSPQNQLVPLTNYGVKTMSMGYLVPESSPVAWRGLMVMKALQQLLHEVEWAGLDVLVLDLPPGTGDTQLTITQQVHVDGALLVTTPHPLALADTLRGASLFSKVNVPVLGVVQNMSSFTCPNCSAKHPVFGSPSNLARAIEGHDVKVVADLPLGLGIGGGLEVGITEPEKPVVVHQPEGEAARLFNDLASVVEKKIRL